MILSVLTDHDLSDLTLSKVDRTRFFSPVVSYLNFIQFTRFLTDSLYLLKLQQNMNISETIDHDLSNVYLLSVTSFTKFCKKSKAL